MTLRSLAITAVLVAACGGGGHPQCDAYLRCYEATGGTAGALDSAYGPNSACWSTSRSAANGCEETCRTSRAALAAAHPDAGCS